jgi:hypothetical protein
MIRYLCLLTLLSLLGTSTAYAKNKSKSNVAKVILVQFENRDNIKDLEWIEISIPESIDTYLQESFVYKKGFYSGDLSLEEDEICEKTNCDILICGEFYYTRNKKQVIIEPHLYYKSSKQVNHLTKIKSNLDNSLINAMDNVSKEILRAVRFEAKRQQAINLARMQDKERKKREEELAKEEKITLIKAIDFTGHRLELMGEFYGAAIYYSGRLGYTSPWWSLGLEAGATSLPETENDMAVKNAQLALTWRFNDFLFGAGVGFHKVRYTLSNSNYSIIIRKFAHLQISYYYEPLPRLFLRPSAYLLYSRQAQPWFGLAAGYRL